MRADPDGQAALEAGVPVGGIGVGVSQAAAITQLQLGGIGVGVSQAAAITQLQRLLGNRVVGELLGRHVDLVRPSGGVAPRGSMFIQRQHYLRGQITPAAKPYLGKHDYERLAEQLRGKKLQLRPTVVRGGGVDEQIDFLEQYISRELVRVVREVIKDKPGPNLVENDLRFKFAAGPRNEFQNKLAEFLEWFGKRTIEVMLPGSHVVELEVAIAPNLTLASTNDPMKAADEFQKRFDEKRSEKVMMELKRIRRVEDACTEKFMNDHVATKKLIQEAREVKRERKGGVPTSSTIDLELRENQNNLIKEFKEKNLDGTYERLSARGVGGGFGQQAISDNEYTLIEFDGNTGERLPTRKARFRYGVQWNEARAIYLIHHFDGAVN